MDSNLLYIKDYYLINSDRELFSTYNNLEKELIENCMDIILYDLSLEKLIALISMFKHRDIKAKNIPQYSNLEDGTLNLVKVLKYTGDEGLKYNDVGEYLLSNDNKMRTREAYYKYGENHSKLACQLGLAKKVRVSNRTKIYLTKIGYNFLKYSKENQLKLINKMSIRIPIIQFCLINNVLKRKEILSVLNNYLSPSTAKRRAPNVNKLLINILEGF